MREIDHISGLQCDMNASSFDFSGRTIIVIGGTSGINLGVAREFAERGGNIGVVSRSTEKVAVAIEYLQESGTTVAGFAADVRNYEALETAFNGFAEIFNSIDVLVSGAAGNFPARATDMSPNGFAAVMNIDLLGTYHVLRAAYPHLVKPGASIINISAPQSYIPMILQSHVCAAKAGVDMLTRTFAMEWGDEGIRVNSIVPGPIENTEGMKRLAPTQGMLDDVVQSVPLKRLGRASDIGRAAMFLASEMAEYVTGAVIPVDGGWSLGGVSGMMDELARQMESGSR